MRTITRVHTQSHREVVQLGRDALRVMTNPNRNGQHNYRIDNAGKQVYGLQSIDPIILNQFEMQFLTHTHRNTPLCSL